MSKLNFEISTLLDLDGVDMNEYVCSHSVEKLAPFNIRIISEEQNVFPKKWWRVNQISLIYSVLLSGRKPEAWFLLVPGLQSFIHFLLYKVEHMRKLFLFKLHFLWKILLLEANIEKSVLQSMRNLELKNRNKGPLEVLSIHDDGFLDPEDIPDKMETTHMVVFVAEMKKYFDYKFCLCSGSPSWWLNETVGDRKTFGTAWINWIFRNWRMDLEAHFARIH